MELIGGNNPQMQMPDLSKSAGVECESCGGIFFKQTLILRTISKLLTGTTHDVLVQVPVFRCDDCNDVLRSTLPVGMPDIDELKSN